MKQSRGKIVLSGLLMLWLTACGQTPSDPPTNNNSGDSDKGTNTNAADDAASMAKKVQVEVLSVEPSTGDRVRVKYKATNTAKALIVRAKATIAVLDADGTDIGSETHWFIRGRAGGLAPGASVENDFLITVSDPKKAESAKFTLELVRGG